MPILNYIKTYRFAIIATIITLTGAACWQLLASPYSDDFAYMQIAQDDEDGAFWTGFGDNLETFDDAVTSSINHWMNVNSRLANILCIYSMLLPPWIPDLLHAVMITAMMLLIIYHIKGRNGFNSPATIALVSILMWIILPWHDCMVSSDFLFNYAWSSVMSLSLLAIFSYNKHLSRRQLSWACALAFLTAWMHEGFTVPTGVACIVILLSNKENRRQRLTLLGVFALGALLCAGPGTVLRFFSHREQHESAAMVHYISRYISQLFIVWIYAAILAIITVRKGRAFTSAILRRQLPLLLGAATGFIIALIASMGNRALWVTLLFITIAALQSLPHAVNGDIATPRLKKLTASIILAVTALFFGGLCYWQNIISSQQRVLLKELIASDTPCAFVDLTPREEIPWWTLAIPRQYCYDNNIAMLTISSYADKDFHAVFAPYRFKGLDFEQWDKIPGDNNFRGKYPLLCSLDSVPVITLRFTVGKPLPAMSPIDRLIVALQGNETATRDLKAFCYPTRDNNNRPIYLYIHEAPGRTIANRELLSIDVIK